MAASKESTSLKIVGFRVPPPSNQQQPPPHSSKDGAQSRERAGASKPRTPPPCNDRHRRSLLTSMLGATGKGSGAISALRSAPRSLNPGAQPFQPSTVEDHLAWSEDEDDAEISDSQGSTLSSFSQPIPIVRRPSRPCSYR